MVKRENACAKMLASMDIFKKYKDEQWRKDLCRHLFLSYDTVENRILQTFQFVTPTQENRDSYSHTFSSILRDSGSAFDSIMRKLIEKTGKKSKYQDNIIGHLDFLKDIETNLEKCSLHLRYNLKTILPFEKDLNSSPLWWRAYNAVKHDDVQRHTDGNLENALKSVAALAIIRLMICGDINTRIFVNIGIIYPESDPSISIQNRLFP